MHLTGWNLKPDKVAVEGKPGEGLEDAVWLRPARAFNEVKLAVGAEPEVESAEAASLEKAQAIPLPVTVNGRIEKAGGCAYYKFHAAKGQKLIVEVNARRLAPIWIRFSKCWTRARQAASSAPRCAPPGKQSPRCPNATRPRPPCGSRPGLRLKPGDFVMMGGEMIKVDVLPKGPDEDTLFERSAGSASAFFDTTPEAHAMDQAGVQGAVASARIQVQPQRFAAWCICIYQNDDGGPGYGKDSLVHFTAPADGDYIVKLRDVQGLGGENYAYRLIDSRAPPGFPPQRRQPESECAHGRLRACECDRAAAGRVRRPDPTHGHDLPAGLQGHARA